MADAALLQTLREHELRLLRPEVRADPTQLGALLHPSFVEIGASGRVYSRDEVLAEFAGAPPAYDVWAQDFRVQAVAPDAFLLLFRTAHVETHGGLSRHVARSSLWVSTDGAWRLRFHQGTPTEPFERSAA